MGLGSQQLADVVALLPAAGAVDGPVEHGGYGYGLAPTKGFNGLQVVVEHPPNGTAALLRHAHEYLLLRVGVAHTGSDVACEASRQPG